ncbi:MAG TPA: NAD(P)H-dependent oxidoreductase [Casimicrobiaceae bacterium]|nr:NAD(P)H-dependent oxidoreductase [Casimicrobiaceae bacterium]
MQVFVVYAHHEPTSFSAALRNVAVDAFASGGHRVVVSDLHAMRFDPVSDRRNFAIVFDEWRLDQQREEKHASARGGFAPDIAAEMEKLARCELLLLHFPIWWLGMPAILKGWVDRVFAAGVAYGGGRYFGTGVMRGKRAMCVVTTGGPASDYDGSGKYDTIERVLYPIHRGILEFTGFTLLPPLVAYAPQRMSEAEKAQTLRRMRARVGAIAKTETEGSLAACERH